MNADGASHSPETAWTRVLRALNSPAALLLLTALAYAFFIGYRFHQHPEFHNNPSGFVDAADHFSHPGLTPPNLIIARHTDGYDGQFYYRIALNPFTRQQTAYGIMIDTPAYRQQRILYPLLAWALSLGQWQWIPGVLILINWLGLCAIGWLAGTYTQALGRHALWGALWAFYPGFLITLGMDLTEILEVCFLLAALLALQRHRPGTLTLFLTLAMLTKETVLLVIVAVLIAWVVSMRPKKVLVNFSGNSEVPALPFWCWAIPMGIYLVWQALLYASWGQSTFAGQSNLGLPFTGIAGYLQQTIALAGMGTRAGRQQFVFLYEVFALATVGLLTLMALRISTAPLVVKVAWLLTVGMLLVLTQSVWVGDIAYLRACVDMYVLGIAILLGTSWKANRLVLAVVLPWYLFLFKGRA